MIDHKKLLEKYMQYVKDCEGITFCDSPSRYDYINWYTTDFSEEEWKVLHDMSEGLNK